MKSAPIRFPEPLKEGDTICIIAPATEVKEEYVYGAASMLRNHGYKVIIAPHTLGHVSGTYAAETAARLDDFIAAYSDEEVKCILCARGGYGCIQLLADIPGSLMLSSPKWIVGFSDVSALHAMMLRHSITSLHAGMAKHIFELGFDDDSVKAAFEIMSCREPQISYTFPAADGVSILRSGIACGQLRGGNFAVLNGLAATEFDILRIDEGEEVILFLEDIGEAIYEVDRMLWRLYLSGSLGRAKGLIFGSFSNYRPDKNHPSMEEMIASRLSLWGIDCPVVLRFPFGHEDGRNYPLVEGCTAELRATDDTVTLIQHLR